MAISGTPTPANAAVTMMSIHEHEVGGNGSEAAAEPDDYADVNLGDLEALRGVVKFPVRIKCATLAWNTFTLGLDEAGADRLDEAG